MRTYDFAPLWRSTIGFDRLFDLLDETQHAAEDNYPPYNIERLGEDRYQISLALAPPVPCIFPPRLTADWLECVIKSRPQPSASSASHTLYLQIARWISSPAL